jgi:hypothetical protein
MSHCETCDYRTNYCANGINHRILDLKGMGVTEYFDGFLQETETDNRQHGDKWRDLR